MKREEFFLSVFIIWLLAVLSLFGIRYFASRKPSVTKYYKEARSIYEHLDDVSKKSISLYESAIIRLYDGTYKIIGSPFESDLTELISTKRLSSREISYQIVDPILIERKILVGEALKNLNNAEKKCFAEGYGAILFRDGSFHFYFDETKYKRYVEKYGTECESCEEIKKADSPRRSP